MFTCDPSPAVLAIDGSRRVRLPQGGPHRPAASVGVRRSAPTADDDARGAAGWPRGETCHVAHGALLRARLRHRVRTHGWSSGGACGVEGDWGAPSGAAAVDPAASSARVKPAPAKLGGGLRRLRVSAHGRRACRKAGAKRGPRRDGATRLIESRIVLECSLHAASVPHTDL